MAEKEEKKFVSGREKAELGLFLRALREKKGLELMRLAEMLGVSEKILQALEENRAELLPPASYLNGILKKYARYFKLDYQELRVLAQLQFPSRSAGQTDTLPDNRFSSTWQSWYRLLNPSVGSWLLLVLFLYLGTQIVSLILPVRITLQESYAVAQSSPLFLQGRLFGNARALYINSQRVELSGKSFSFPLFLNPGPNSVELVAENYLGRKTVVRKIIALSSASASPEPTSTLSPSPSPVLPSITPLPTFMFSPFFSPSPTF